MRLSVVVPATNRPPTLPRCLEAIAAAGPDEVIVVETAAGTGPAAARNAGAARAGGELIAFVDADVLVHRDAFDRIRDRFAKRPELVAVFGSYDERVATRGEVAAFRNLLHHTIHQRSQGDVATFWAALGAVRASALAQTDGFDALRYPRPAIEDIELGTRLAALGPIVLDGEIRGTHLKEWTLGTMIATDFARRGIPWVELIHERAEVPSTLNLGRRERASAGAAFATAIALVAGRPRVAVLAIAAGVALNRDLYAVLARQRGVRGAAIGVPLHLLHQLTAGAAIPAGLVRGRRRRR
ncbi:MAG: glycosyltransferase family 2 protein [Gaiellales bacterium]